MSYKLILRSKNSPFSGQFSDMNLSSVLSHADLDNNFINLKGNLIYTADTSGTTLTMYQINGEEITVDLSGISVSGNTSGDTYVDDVYVSGTTLVVERNDGTDFNVSLSGITSGTTTFNGLTDTTINTPNNGDYLIYSGGVVVNLSQINVYFTASTASQTIFNVLPLMPINNNNTSLFVNGVKQRYNNDYTITGGTTVVWITSKHNIDTDDVMEITYI